MFRVITKRHKHTRRRGTMRKKNPTMRRRHSSHLKHSRRNLHKSRSRRGGVGAFGWTLKAAHKLTTGIQKAKRQAEWERRQQEGELIRRQLLTTRPKPFQAPWDSVFTGTPQLSAAPAQFSMEEIYNAESPPLIYRASQRPLIDRVPTNFLPTFSSGVKPSSKRGSLPGDTNP